MQTQTGSQAKTQTLEVKVNDRTNGSVTPITEMGEAKSNPQLGGEARKGEKVMERIATVYLYVLRGGPMSYEASLEAMTSLGFFLGAVTQSRLRTVYDNFLQLNCFHD